MTNVAVHAIGPLLFGIALSAPLRATAGEISAIIEEAPQRTGVAVMDYVEADQVIRLEPGEVLILGYLSSCLREAIEGGTVRIGTERSEVTGGTVTRKKVDCLGGGLQLSKEQAQQSGVMISRSLRPPEVKGLQPVFLFASGDILRIVREDKAGTPIEIPVSGRRAIDLVDANIMLEAGGRYKAEAGEKSLSFVVSPTAGPGKTELLSRLLAF